MSKHIVKIDYSLYLVTGRGLLPSGKDYLESLEQSLQGGVNVVQIREKDTDTAEFLQIALESKAICDRYKVPILINDRIDIALAINADGVHLGQSDMPIAIARRLLPKDSIIGVSCNDLNHIKTAVQEGADYVGIGSVWRTKTKALTSPIVGVRGVGAMLEALDGTEVKAVAIGGINSTNLLRTLHGTVSRTNHALDGVAVVSDIVASTDPLLAAKRLSGVIHAFKGGLSIQLGLGFKAPSEPGGFQKYTSNIIIEGAIQLFERIRHINPLVHQITNTVVSTQSANVTLALGASPIMASSPEEMEDLARISGALLVNIGTLIEDARNGMLKAGHFANVEKKPVVLDPVGVGATAYRRKTVNDLLNTWQASVIKGNAGELAALAGSMEVESKGVDSVGVGFKDPVSFVKALAKKERCIIVLTGPTDYVSDGHSVVLLRNGDEMLGRITGAGCVAGTCIAAFCATAAALAAQSDTDGDDGRLVKGDMLLGAISGVLALTISAELAVKREDVRGSGTFLPALIDELGALTPDVVKRMAKIEVIA